MGWSVSIEIISKLFTYIPFFLLRFGLEVSMLLVVDADLDVSLLVLDEVVLDLVELVLAAVLVVWVPGAVLPVADLELEQSVEKESRQ